MITSIIRAPRKDRGASRTCFFIALSMLIRPSVEQGNPSHNGGDNEYDDLPPLYAILLPPPDISLTHSSPRRESIPSSPAEDLPLPPSAKPSAYSDAVSHAINVSSDIADPPARDSSAVPMAVDLQHDNGTTTETPLSGYVPNDVPAPLPDGQNNPQTDFEGLEYMDAENLEYVPTYILVRSIV